MRGSLKKIGRYYYATIDIGKSNEVDKNGKPKRIQKRINTHCEKKPEAEKVLADLINQINNNTFVNQIKITFVDYLKQWLEKQKLKCEQTTYEGYKLILEKHIEPYFKDIELQKIQSIDLQNYYDLKLRKGRADSKGGLSPNTVLKHHAIIHKALKQACKLNIIKLNHADNVELPDKKKYIINKVYDDKEINQLLNCVKETPIETAIYLGALLGLRRGEILGLKWNNIIFEKNEIHIINTRVRFSGKTIDKKPKTDTSRRILIAPIVLISLT